MCILNFSFQRSFAHDTFTIRPDTGLPIETLLINFIPLRKKKLQIHGFILKIFFEINTANLRNLQARMMQELLCIIM